MCWCVCKCVCVGVYVSVCVCGRDHDMQTWSSDASTYIEGQALPVITPRHRRSVSAPLDIGATLLGGTHGEQTLQSYVRGQVCVFLCVCICVYMRMVCVCVWVVCV